MIGYIYSITSISGRVYIGSSVSPSRRWARYLRGLLDNKSNFKFREEFKIQDCTWSNFTCKIDYTIEVNSFTELQRIEGRAIRRVPNELSLNVDKYPEIKYWDKYPLTENLLMKGKRHSEETKNKIAKAHRNKPHPHKGHPISNEGKKGISSASVGEKGGNSKLMDDQRREIWYKRNVSKTPVTELMLKYNTASRTIYRIAHDERWEND